MKFIEWLKHRESGGKPHAPSKVKKLHRKETFSKGSRDLRDDLSKDYPGNMEFQGDVGPYKVLGGRKYKAEGHLTLNVEDLQSGIPIECFYPGGKYASIQSGLIDPSQPIWGRMGEWSLYRHD